MFYSSEVLTKRGSLAKVWLAATRGKSRISRAYALSVPIDSLCSQIEDHGIPLALRLKAQLLLGVVRIYEKKCSVVVSDLAGRRSVPMIGDIDLPRHDTSGAALLVLSDLPQEDTMTPELFLHVHPANLWPPDAPQESLRPFRETAAVSPERAREEIGGYQASLERITLPQWRQDEPSFGPIPELEYQTNQDDIEVPVAFEVSSPLRLSASDGEARFASPTDTAEQPERSPAPQIDQVGASRRSRKARVTLDKTTTMPAESVRENMEDTTRTVRSFKRPSTRPASTGLDNYWSNLFGSQFLYLLVGSSHEPPMETETQQDPPLSAPLQTPVAMPATGGDEIEPPEVLRRHRRTLVTDVTERDRRLTLSSNGTNAAGSDRAEAAHVHPDLSHRSRSSPGFPMDRDQFAREWDPEELSPIHEAGEDGFEAFGGIEVDIDGESSPTRRHLRGKLSDGIGART